ncbi:unnamed protein product [Heligmosomoides polygyrus]|uniref:Transcriptional regulator n=1 Tax=Heligmosomoides polygyrus TaxID=6339 RepID=A0A183FQT5_HELPZ|nr:unnamed protein product [Heligmosomoides polygyrus]
MEKKCSTMVSKVAIIQGCSISELSCAELSQVVGIKSLDGKRTKHAVDEVRSARCWDGEWQVETLNGTLSIDDIVCFV